MEKEILVRVGSIFLAGDLYLPKQAKGLVLFAHGSGSSRHSPRNQAVAKKLNQQGLATLLIDLLSAEEEKIDRESAILRFDIELLAGRLVGIIDWLKENLSTQSLGLGLFGASTGAAAALIAAAEKEKGVQAVVSRGGRPDLAAKYLHRVKVPTLLLVGGEDYPVIEMNQKALSLLKCEKKMTIIPNATHLFEEPGTLEEVAHLAAEWFLSHLIPVSYGN